MGGAAIATDAGTAGGGGSAFITPGKKNVAGETLPPALTPEQPAAHSVKNASIASRAKFQLNLTCLV
jgi:hypothetical protein